MARTRREEERRGGSAQERGGVGEDRRKSKGGKVGKGRVFKKFLKVERKEGEGRKEKGEGGS